jgi:two-component system, cell cycle response regulator CpdR
MRSTIASAFTRYFGYRPLRTADNEVDDIMFASNVAIQMSHNGIADIPEDEVASIMLTEPILGARVLLADDDAAMRDVMARHLTRSGFEVVQAGDGASAYRLAQSPNDPADLIVLDINMPMLSGIDVLRQIRGQHVNTPVLLISGENMTPSLNALLKRLHATMLRKPFGLDIFGDAALAAMNNAYSH